MRRWTLVSSLLTFCCVATARAETRVSVAFKSGRVSVKATDATPRDILVEWARQGGTRIVNANEVPGAAWTIELVDVPERHALDVLLREAGGYLAAPRQGGQDGLSRYDRILILPSSAAQIPPRSSHAPRQDRAQVPEADSTSASPIASGDIADVDDGDTGLPPGLADVLRLNPPPATQAHDRDSK
jgi:hypothetical protein